MNGWNEQTLRAAASWRAFKEGRELHARGSVSTAKTTPSGWQGTVIAGKRPLRVSVTVRSPDDLETRCPCPENQAAGTFCCHAVATGLAALAASHPTTRPTTESTPEPAGNATPHDIILPPRWRDTLAMGRMHATLTRSSRSSPDPADARLSAWLHSQHTADDDTLHLHLDARQLAGFLDAITGHPAVFTGKERNAVTITTGHRIHLTHAELLNGNVELSADPPDGTWHDLNGSLWHAEADSIKRAGTHPAPADTYRILQTLCRGETHTLPLRQFLTSLDSWQDWLAFPADCWLQSLHFIPAPASFNLSLKGSLKQLTAGLSVAYAGAPPIVPGYGDIPSLPRLHQNECEIRNIDAESQAVRQLEQSGFQTHDPASGSWTLTGDSPVLRFLTQTLPALNQQWQVSHDPHLSRLLSQITVISPKIHILGSGTDWLGFNLKFQTNDGIELPAQEIQHLIRSGSSQGRIAGNRLAILSDEITDLIEPLFQDLNLNQESGHFKADQRTGEIIQEICKNQSKSFDSSNLNISDFDQPTSLQAKLRPYQSQGAYWLIDRVERFGGALLADDMGLGKTLQTIALIEHLFSKQRADSGTVLVIATTSLLGNWLSEFRRFAPGRVVRMLHGSDRDRQREQLRPGEVAITSYGTLARDLAWHLRQDYRAVVVDEASLMRNPDTDHAKAIAKLRSQHRVALTGTPVENSVRDLWSIFRFIQPGWLGGREVFRDRYETPLTNPGEAPAVMRRLRLKISPFVLRRTKEQVAPELPSKLVIDEYCDLSKDQQTVYAGLLNEGRKQVDELLDGPNAGSARMRILTTLLRLRQSCCDLSLLQNDRLKQLPLPQRSAKLERLLELLDEAVKGNHKILVFSQFQKQLLEIEKSIMKRGIASLRLDGQTRNRQELVDAFQSPDGPPVFLISLKAGGYGLNLTAADTVVHFDPWWNPAAEAQATDRAHRIGQIRPVTVYRLLARGTVEEQVLRLQARKRALAEAIDESGAGDAPGWSMEELKAMIRNG
jgi:superfamily II DNA or RNA helicase